MTDLVVAGGGPAGLAVAIEARQRGLSVVVVDRARPPVDKACGEGLMPDGVARLAAMGVHVAPEQCAPIAGIRYLDDEAAAEARFPGPAGLGVRRTVLHAAMVHAAQRAGARLVWGVSVVGLTARGIETTSGSMPAEWMVAADGLRSTLRAQAGLEGPPSRHRRFGVTRHYAVQPWTDLVEVHWGDSAEAYVTPVGPREVGVAILWSGAPAPFARRLQAFPLLAERLHGAPLSSRPGGAGPLEQRVRGVVQGRLALVGDAAGYLDAIAGDGLSMAFHDACAVVEALCRGSLDGYESAHRRARARATAATRLLVALERRPRLRRMVMAALASDPRAFSAVLAWTVGQAPTWPDAAAAVFRLGWRVALQASRGDVAMDRP